MSDQAAKKVGFVVTHAGDDPERATLPFMLATGAMTMGVEPVVILQAEGVRLALPGAADQVQGQGLAPLGTLVDAVLGAGYRIMACSPCLASRGIDEEGLRDGVYVGGAGLVVQEMLECENFLVY
jgi:predicted peroxiredoxin